MTKKQLLTGLLVMTIALSFMACDDDNNEQESEKITLLSTWVVSEAVQTPKDSNNHYFTVKKGSTIEFTDSDTVKVAWTGYIYWPMSNGGTAGAPYSVNKEATYTENGNTLSFTLEHSEWGEPYSRDWVITYKDLTGTDIILDIKVADVSFTLNCTRQE